MNKYFYKDYEEFTAGNRPNDVAIIDDALSNIQPYDGEIYLAMNLTPARYGEFVDVYKI